MGRVIALRPGSPRALDVWERLRRVRADLRRRLCELRRAARRERPAEVLTEDEAATIAAERRQRT